MLPTFVRKFFPNKSPTSPCTATFATSNTTNRTLEPPPFPPFPSFPTSSTIYSLASCASNETTLLYPERVAVISALAEALPSTAPSAKSSSPRRRHRHRKSTPDLRGSSARPTLSRSATAAAPSAQYAAVGAVEPRMKRSPAQRCTLVEIAESDILYTHEPHRFDNPAPSPLPALPPSPSTSTRLAHAKTRSLALPPARRNRARNVSPTTLDWAGAAFPGSPRSSSPKPARSGSPPDGTPALLAAVSLSFLAAPGDPSFGQSVENAMASMGSWARM